MSLNTASLKTKRASHSKNPQSKGNFNSRCYALLCKVPRGKVTTYAALARALGSKGYRAVGNAMNRNENAPIVPCHRVVKSDGSIGGYALGPKKKIAILEREGVKIRGGKVENFEKKLFVFKSARKAAK